jgi:hypothetical protein
VKIQFYIPLLITDMILESIFVFIGFFTVDTLIGSICRVRGQMSLQSTNTSKPFPTYFTNLYSVIVPMVNSIVHIISWTWSKLLMADFAKIFVTNFDMGVQSKFTSKYNSTDWTLKVLIWSCTRNQFVVMTTIGFVPKCSNLIDFS